MPKDHVSTQGIIFFLTSITEHHTHTATCSREAVNSACIFCSLFRHEMVFHGNVERHIRIGMFLMGEHSSHTLTLLCQQTYHII
jgi:hypothetical protein